MLTFEVHARPLVHALKLFGVTDVRTWLHEIIGVAKGVTKEWVKVTS
jgi:hypothetical protein